MILQVPSLPWLAGQGAGQRNLRLLACGVLRVQGFRALGLGSSGLGLWGLRALGFRVLGFTAFAHKPPDLRFKVGVGSTDAPTSLADSFELQVVLRGMQTLAPKVSLTLRKLVE